MVGEVAQLDVAADIACRLLELGRALADLPQALQAELGRGDRIALVSLKPLDVVMFQQHVGNLVAQDEGKLVLVFQIEQQADRDADHAVRRRGGGIEAAPADDDDADRRTRGRRMREQPIRDIVQVARELRYSH